MNNRHGCALEAMEFSPQPAVGSCPPPRLFWYNGGVRSLLATLLLASIGLATGCRPAEPTRQGVSMLVRTAEAPWSSERSQGRAITSRHYRLYTTSRNRALIAYMPGFMEAAYDNYLQLTGLSGTQTEPMPIYLMATREEWALLTASVVGRQAQTYLSIQAGGYCYKGVCVFWDIGGLGTMAVASHEGLHQFLAHNLRDRLPMWLEEGLCTTAEGYEILGSTVRFTPDSNISRFNHLRNAIVQDYWIALHELLPMDAGDAIGRKFAEKAVGYYGQLWALVQFIRSRPQYEAGMKRLLAEAAAGRLHEALGVPAPALRRLRARGRIYNRTVAEPLFRHYISSDLADFDRQYKAFARQLTWVR